MIAPGAELKIYIATRPVDFRCGHDGLAAKVQEMLGLDPFSGAAFVFRSKRAERIKILVWDRTVLVLVHKRLEGCKFVWPKIADGVMRNRRRRSRRCSKAWIGGWSARRKLGVHRLLDNCGRMTRSRVTHGAGGGDALDIAHEHRDAARRERTPEGAFGANPSGVERASGGVGDVGRSTASVGGHSRRTTPGEVRAKSEKLRPDQYHLPLEDVEIAQGVLDAAQEKAAAIIRGRSRAGSDQDRHRNRGCLPAHCLG
ncbi:transposase [Bradyrhizobium sp. i1.3.6]